MELSAFPQCCLSVVCQLSSLERVLTSVGYRWLATGVACYRGYNHRFYLHCKGSSVWEEFWFACTGTTTKNACLIFNDKYVLSRSWIKSKLPVIFKGELQTIILFNLFHGQMRWRHIKNHCKKCTYALEASNLIPKGFHNHRPQACGDRREQCVLFGCCCCHVAMWLLT